MGKGVKRYVNNSNAGPMFVYVKDGKIIRMTPIEFDDSDAPSFHHRSQRTEIYSAPQRHHFPVRLFFEIHGLFSRPDFISHETSRFRSQRRTESGKQRYLRLSKRISWDEALDIVAKRDQTGQKRSWSRVLSSAARFSPHLGQCRLLFERSPPIYQRHRRHPGSSQSG